MSRQEQPLPVNHTAAHQTLKFAQLQAELIAAREALATRKAAMYYAATTTSCVAPAAASAPLQATAYDKFLRGEARRIALQVLKARARATASSTVFMRAPNANGAAYDPALYSDEEEEALLNQLPTSCYATKMDGEEVRLPTVDFLSTPRAVT